ncbi:MAG: hypothetical protein EOM05_00715 [Clostridia bacterium]|nr:hypothetical protein [Clostridia bacterium]
MATKYQLITEAYERELATISTPQRWQNFLISACRNYKCRFDEQVLIFAQRPDATAVLEIDKWNRQFNRWVNKGSNGIAVFDKTSQNKRLKYYFDVSDTHEGRNAKAVPIWQMNPAFENEVIDTLESTFGELSSKENLIDAIFSASENAATDNLTDYINDLKYYVEDSFLDGTGEDYITKSYRELVRNSVAFMIMERLGLNTGEYFSNEDFSAITDFNTKDTINALGIATSDIAEMGLKEIATTVIALQKSDKKQIRTFVDNSNQEYNISINKTERNFEYEQSNLQQSGRLQPTEPDTATGAGSSPWEVRIGSQEISGNQSQSDVYQSANLLQAESTPTGSGRAGLRDDGNADRTDGTDSRRNGAIESYRPNEVGSDDEQYQELSSGNSDEGANLQLNAQLPTQEEQQNIIEESEVLKTSDFSISQEEIDAILTNGSGVADGKYRIYEQYLKKETQAENATFLKDEYGWGGAYPALRESDIDEMHDGKGIKLSKGSIMEPDAEVLLPWNKVAKRIDELITSESYLNEKELANFPVYQQRILESNERWQVGKEFNNIIRDYNEYMKVLGENEKLFNQYVLTDCGSCFAGKSKKTNTLSGKGNFILPIMQDAMDKVISDNTPQTDRATSMKDILNGDMAVPVLPELEPEYEYQYHLGDTVYIGAKKYEILSFDDESVRLYDESFPLFNKEMERADFDNKVQENPSNDHLMVIVPEIKEVQQSQEKRSPYSQYLEIKEEYPLDIVTFQVGDFYEFYLEDAKIASDIIGLHLGTRVIDGEYVSMCGIPKHKLEEYMQKILDEGHDFVIHGADENGVVASRKVVSSHKYDKPQEVETNIGTVPIEDYREIQAIQNGFDSYEDMRNQGFKLGDEYDTDYTPDIAEEIHEENFDNEYDNDELASIYGGNTASAQAEIIEEMAQQNSNDDLIGQRLTIDNRDYVIEGVRSYGDVEMRDVTFENAVGFPINRLENAGYIRRLLAEKETKDITQNFDKKPKSDVKTFDIHPEIKQSDRSQYVITNDDLGVGSAKEKFRANMAAINLLKELEFDNRLATPAEQEILAGYVGFGSLADAFDENKSAWANEFQELYATLSPEEYANARESTLTAFYTAPTIIRNMYKALENMGLSKGNILEPSCGTGNFIGMLPDSMKESKIYGVELDSLTGRIAQQLYQKSSIAVQGFETTQLPDSFFDAAIGNVPFGQFKVDDKKYNKNNWLIHDYFFGKTLDKVRPGGVVAFITSKGTLDKENPAVRKYLAQRADLIGAIRLPNNAFKANAGTEVTSDIIFLQKRDRIIDIEPDWVHLGKDENGLTMNQYFVDSPHMIMGEMREISGPFGPETACIANTEQTLDDQLSDAIGNIHAVIDDYEREELTDDEDLSIPADPTVRNFSYALFDGTIYYRENSRMNPVDVSKTAENRIKGMIEIRNTVRYLIEYQTEDYPESYITQAQKELNTLYDNFTKKYGLLSSRANSMAFSNDSSYACK